MYVCAWHECIASTWIQRWIHAFLLTYMYTGILAHMWCRPSPLYDSIHMYEYIHSNRPEQSRVYVPSAPWRCSDRYTNTYTYIHTYIHVHTSNFSYIPHDEVFIDTHTYIYTYMYIPEASCISLPSVTRQCLHTYIHTYIHIFIYIHTWYMHAYTPQVSPVARPSAASVPWASTLSSPRSCPSQKQSV